jgi:hypothetical protein
VDTATFPHRWWSWLYFPWVLVSCASSCGTPNSSPLEMLQDKQYIFFGMTVRSQHMYLQLLLIGIALATLCALVFKFSALALAQRQNIVVINDHTIITVQVRIRVHILTGC